MAEINTSPQGPHNYELLEKLCKENKCQVLVYSGLLSEPAWNYPKELTLIQPDLPTIFLQEKVSLGSPDLFHVDVIIRPEMVNKKFICTVCYRLILNGKAHMYNCIRRSCFYCKKRNYKKGTGMTL